jgi:hypothetical protein
MSSSSCFGALRDVNIHTGSHLGLSVPLLSLEDLRKWPCHLANRAFALYRILCRPRVSGSPKYVIGKLTHWPVKASRIWSRFNPKHLMGTIEHFAMFSLSLVATPKLVRILRSAPTSCSARFNKKITTSSTYRDILSLASLPRIGDRIPSYVKRPNTLYSVSIVRMKRYGDSGSPCLRPLTCLIFLQRGHM